MEIIEMRIVEGRAVWSKSPPYCKVNAETSKQASKHAMLVVS
jgi:hypothetical protein